MKLYKKRKMIKKILSYVLSYVLFMLFAACSFADEYIDGKSTTEIIIQQQAQLTALSSNSAVAITSLNVSVSNLNVVVTNSAAAITNLTAVVTNNFINDYVLSSAASQNVSVAYNAQFLWVTNTLCTLYMPDPALIPSTNSMTIKMTVDINTNSLLIASIYCVTSGVGSVNALVLTNSGTSAFMCDLQYGGTNLNRKWRFYEYFRQESQRSVASLVVG